MRRLFLLGCLVFICISSFAQTAADTTLATYLKQKRYVAITDTIHFSKSILPYYQAIMDYMTEDKLDMRNFYIPVAGARDETYTLTISLWDLASIKIKKLYDEDTSNTIHSYIGEGRKVIITRAKPPLALNPSGHCGGLIINKLSGKVMFKLY